ncbi:hypothetical protein CANCADRAFT_46189 [Tortispora caseinolytica NRRL Y-17796]|uniref:Nucleoporin Nup133/Nup155-like N-terminal domain-containing protein n=1 Tax=Tortispora caseinolytica NRRL Y-17796 TaxID=767744 RepID=A0A1E4TDJ0_9ASCO|nr:hypothetical protein CANCADRAFT_46189 [Tortispora caseinolytica NRRL Y-17796]
MSESILWAKSSRYAVTALPAVPHTLHQLSADATANVRGCLDSSSRFALLASSTSIHVWNYSEPESIPATYTVNVPESHVDSRPVLSALVPPSSFKDPGALAFTSKGATYWESVGSAATDGLLVYSQAHSVSLNLSRVESPQYLKLVHPLGALLATSSGRIFLVSLTDHSANPSLSVCQIRAHDPNNAGFWNSLKSTLSLNTPTRNIVAIRIISSSATAAKFLYATAEAYIGVWSCDKSATATIHSQFNCFDLLVNSVAAIYPHARANLTICDAEYTNDHAMLLASAQKSSDYTDYFLFIVSLDSADPQVLSTYHITSTSVSSANRPALFLPYPHNTVFITTSSTVVIVDFTVNPYKFPFEDNISFRDNVSILAAGSEPYVQETLSHPGQNAAVVITAAGAGVVRIERYFHDDSDISFAPSSVESSLVNTLTSKVQQAVFYTEVEDSPIEFYASQQALALTGGIETLESIVLKVSHDILTSSSMYMPDSMPSTEEHLAYRRSALYRLARYATAQFPEISISTRIQLMTDLEMCEAALLIWQIWDRKLESLPSTSIIPNLSLYQGLAKITTINSVNDVRSWFIKHIDQLPELLVALSDLAESMKSAPSFDSIDQITDISNICVASILSGAYLVRQEHQVSLYGIDSVADYVPESPTDFQGMWTSQLKVCEALVKVYETLLFLIQNTAKTSELVNALTLIVRCTCRTFSERIGWLFSLMLQLTEGNRNDCLSHAEDLTDKFAEFRRESLLALYDLGVVKDATELAEEYQDFTILAELTDRLRLVSGDMQLMVHFLDKYGYDFAQNLCQYFYDSGKSNLILQCCNNYLPYVEKYLTSFDELPGDLNKVYWIFKVMHRDYADGSSKLMRFAESKEDAASKVRLQLALTKLGFLAAGVRESKVDEELLTSDAMHNLQMDVQRVVDPTRPLTVQADAAREAIGDTISKRNENYFVGVLEQGMKKLLQDIWIPEHELAELLTLVDTRPNEHSMNRFFQALYLISLANSGAAVKDQLIRSTWRRCIIADDWNSTLKQDSSLLTDNERKRFAESTLFYRTMKLCIETQLFEKDESLAINDASKAIGITEMSIISAANSAMSESARKMLQHDLTVENRILEDLISNGVNEWIEGIVTSLNAN